MAAARSPHIWVIDPDLLDSANSPADLIRARGREGWTRAAAAPICGITARAVELLGTQSDLHQEPARRNALARASAWLDTF